MSIRHYVVLRLWRSVVTSSCHYVVMTLRRYACPGKPTPAVLVPPQPVSTYVRALIGLRTHVLTHAHTLTDVRTYGIMVL